MGLDWFDSDKLQEYKHKEMNPRVRAIWADALRSRTYNPNHSLELRSGLNRWSPLGILIQLYRVHHPDEYLTWVRCGSKGHRYWGVLYEVRRTTSFALPPQVARWVGLPGAKTVHVMANLEYVHLEYSIVDAALQNVQRNPLLYVPVNALHENGVPLNAIADLIEQS